MSVLAVVQPHDTKDGEVTNGRINNYTKNSGNIVHAIDEIYPGDSAIICLLPYVHIKVNDLTQKIHP